MKTPKRPESLPAILKMSFGFFGIQFGWGLQMANMSAIYKYLGASEGALPILWLAAPMTGFFVQPLIGYFSDRTWTRLGRRRPYFLSGAILASLALLAMPNASAVWMAAGLLWILDASVNVSMEPFRAFVADLLPPERRQLGFSVQSLLIGAGAVLASYLPWLLTHLGLASGLRGASAIPLSVRLAFDVGAVVFIASVVYTVVTTPELPPEGPNVRSERPAWLEILSGVFHMPATMRKLAVVQFFTWFGLFCLWIYFSPTVAHRVFGGVPGSPAYDRGVEWADFCFGTYNLVAVPASFALILLARRRIGARTLHRIGLTCAGAGLLSVALIREPHLLLLSMLGIGVGWATTLSMPYAMLANCIPPARMGFYMGVFNLFIVLPQILAAAVLGFLVTYAFGGSSVPAIVLGGLSLLLGAAALSLVPVREPALTAPGAADLAR